MKRQGFTIVEVLVALALFVMLATVIVGGYLNVIQGYEHANLQGSREAWVSYARAAVLAEPQRENAEKEGEFSDGDVQIRWRATIEPTEVPNLFAVTLTCEWREPGKAAEKHEEVLRVMRPTWGDEAEQGPLKEAMRARIREVVDAQALNQQTR